MWLLGIELGTSGRAVSALISSRILLFSILFSLIISSFQLLNSISLTTMSVAAAAPSPCYPADEAQGLLSRTPVPSSSLRLGRLAWGGGEGSLKRGDRTEVARVKTSPTLLSREAERLLQPQPLGCYLVRFSESAVTFVLSYR
jgi:hypothetical protein